MASTRAHRHAPWSASKVQTALRCSREFHYRYVDKVKEAEVMPEARIGKAIHTALEQALQGAPVETAKSSARELLEDEWEQARYDTIGQGMQAFVDRIVRFRHAKRVTKQLIEYRLAVRDNFTSTQFYAPDAFFRGVLDAAYLFGDGNIALVDHKTGARHLWHTITEQLQGYAVLAAASFPGARRYWLGIHWVADADVDWADPVEDAAIAQRFVPSLLDNIEAAALAVADGPRPNPSEWCEVCSDRNLCPAAQEIRYQPVDDDGPDPEE